MGTLTKEQQRELEEMMEAAKKLKAPPGHKIHNPDKFTMPLTEPKKSKDKPKPEKAGGDDKSGGSSENE